MKGKYSFAALLAVVGLSITFGMILGGRLNAPRVAQAAKGVPGGFPASDDKARAGLPTDFAEIAEAAIPAVVSVTNTSVRPAEENPHAGLEDDPMFRWFFGPQGPGGQQQGPDRRNRRNPDERTVSSGSGFIISKEGYILTNNHVVEKATKLEVQTNNGDKYVAEVVGTDPTIDMALIKINPKGKDLPVLPLGDSDKLRVGEWAIAIGDPLELEHTVTVGVISAKKRQVPIGETIPGIASFIQTDAAINFGNSGGPLLNARGQVIGINTAIVRNDGFRAGMVEGIGFALAINEARRAAEQIKESGSVQRGYLGITMNPEGIDEKAKDYYGLPDAAGVLVLEVAKDGPSAKAGLKKDDVIRKVDGQKVEDNTDLLSKIASRRPGEKIDLEIFRDGKTLDLTVTLAKRPDLNELASAQPMFTEPEEDKGAEALGIRVEAISPRARSQSRIPDDVRGVVVTDVDAGSDADDAGLRQGIIIVSVNGTPVPTVADWNRATKGIKPGSTAKLEIAQGNRTAMVFVRAGEPKK